MLVGGAFGATVTLDTTGVAPGTTLGAVALGLLAFGVEPAAALLLAGVLMFGIMVQFNQTLFRTDLWCLLGLCLAAGRLAEQEEIGS